MPWPLSSSVGWCARSMTEVAKLMCTCLGWCLQAFALADAIEWRRSPHAHKLCLMFAMHEQCCVANVHTTFYVFMPWPMPPDIGPPSFCNTITCNIWCVKAMYDIICLWPMCACHNWCCLIYSRTKYMICACLERYGLTMSNARRPQSISHSRWAHTIDKLEGLECCHMTLEDACRPWVMSRNQCAHITCDACRPWLILISLEGIVCHLRICNVRWSQTITNDS